MGIAEGSPTTIHWEKFTNNNWPRYTIYQQQFNEIYNLPRIKNKKLLYKILNILYYIYIIYYIDIYY